MPPASEHALSANHTMSHKTDVIQVTTTTANRDDAQRIARELVRQRLAACVQVYGPVSSIYHWQGKLETSDEWTCIVKTRLSHYQAVESAIRQLHPYELPEILALPVVAGSEDYLAWVEAELCQLEPPHNV
jgi:periplasmic divalent cation tolerance protein